MPKSSSPQWLKEHFNDPYVKQAHTEGYRSRAVYKLIELQQKGMLFKPGMLVIDLGAAPGSWSQILTQWVGLSDKVIAVDLLPMDPIKGAIFIQGDFAEQAVVDQINVALNNRKADWVVSDMSPNLSGVNSVDQPRAMALSELALDFATNVLKAEGSFLVKVFQGESFAQFLVAVRKHFKQVKICKPKASRGRSREVYIVARNRIGQPGCGL